MSDDLDLQAAAAAKAFQMLDNIILYATGSAERKGISARDELTAAFAAFGAQAARDALYACLVDAELSESPLEMLETIKLHYGKAAKRCG